MKKLIVKDKKNRLVVKESELQTFILKQIANNINFLKTVRWNAIYKLANLQKKTSKTFINNRCIKTINKKTFHKFSNFSRTVFYKLAKSGLISGLQKSSW